MKTVFSVGAAPRLYKEDLRPAEKYNRGSLLRRQSKTVEKRWQERN
jgi:hypothetical protein